MWGADALLAVAFFSLAVLELTRHVEERHQHASLGVDITLQAVFCATLVLRTHEPRAALVAMSAAYLLPSILTAHAVLFFGDFVPFLLVTYAVTVHGPESWSRIAWLTGVVFWAGLVIRSGHFFAEVRNPLLSVGIPLIVWAVARVVRRLAEQRVRLEMALERLALEQAEREHLAVTRERSRVAAEMHDVVAHAVSLMVVQIGDARMGLERTGGARPQLRSAEQAGRQALVELRRSLGVLRASAPSEAHDAADQEAGLPC
jgi:signal transduction histidine kinase